jgi:hypothetical protein
MPSCDIVRKISFYFQRIEAIKDDLDVIIQLHKESFMQHGWEVVHLDESVSRHHSLFDTFNDDKSIFAASRNGWVYTRTCYMRWLAYAMAGYPFADFDVINYGFRPQDAIDLRRLAGRPVFLSIAGAVGLFEGREYDEVLETFLDYQNNPVVEGWTEIDVNDMNILLQCRPDLFSLIDLEDTRIARDYSCPGWDSAKLVHYPYHYTKPPRSKACRALTS